MERMNKLSLDFSKLKGLKDNKDKCYSREISLDNKLDKKWPFKKKNSIDASDRKKADHRRWMKS